MGSKSRQFATLGAALLLMGTLLGCGQKGPLYLPETGKTDARQDTGETKSKTAKRG